MSVTAYKWMKTPFGNAGALLTIPETVQGDGSVSYPEGFGPDYALDPATQPAALNIPRDKSNQLYNDITKGLKYYQEGKIPQWISTADNGGTPFAYDLYAYVLYTDGLIYQSMLAANTDTPGATANWVRQRLRLGANTTFYVATTGSDSTGTGLVGAPWRTAQFASDMLQKNYDLNGFTVTIMRAAGAYTDGVIVSGGYVGAKGPTVIFDGASMATVTVTSACPYQGLNGASFIVQNQKLVATTFCINAAYNTSIGYSSIDFGTATQAHISAAYSSLVSCSNNYTISGSSPSHVSTSLGGAWVANAVTVTLTGTPAFSSGFVNAQQSSAVNSLGVTWSGAATGPRYSATLNGVIYTTGSGANYFPGNSAGSTATGGQYA
jgi:hypothetical protein